MSEAAIQSEGGRIKVSGEMTFASVTALLDRSREAFAQAGEMIEVDLANVEWMRTASAEGKTIRFFGLPEQMQAIAAASDLDSILPIAS